MRVRGVTIKECFWAIISPDDFKGWSTLDLHTQEFFVLSQVGPQHYPTNVKPHLPCPLDLLRGNAPISQTRFLSKSSSYLASTHEKSSRPFNV